MLEQWPEHYGAFAYFIILFLESLGAPMPGETVLVIGSVLAINGKLDIITMLLCAFTGGVLGNCVGYAIGYFGGKKLILRYGHFIKLTPERLEKFEKALDKKGFYFILTARFIIILRQLNGIIAGAGGMNFYKFFIANVLGCAAWVLCWGAAPYIISKFF